MKVKIASLPKWQLIILCLLTAAVGTYTIIRSGATGGAPILYVDSASRGGHCDDSRVATDVTITAPWCSLKRALSPGVTPSGATVYIRAGNYQGPVFNGPGNANSGVPNYTSMTIFAGYPNDSARPVITSTLIINYCYSAGCNYGNSPTGNMTFKGLNFDTQDRGILISNWSNLQLINNEIDSTEIPPSNYPSSDCPGANTTTDKCQVKTGSGIRLGPPGNGGVVQGNYFHDLAEGLYTVPDTNYGGPDTENLTIQDNVFEHVSDPVIEMSFLKNATIKHNQFISDCAYNNIDPGSHPDALYLQNSLTNVTIDGNYIWGNNHYVTNGSGQPVQNDAGASAFGPCGNSLNNPTTYDGGGRGFLIESNPAGRPDSCGCHPITGLVIKNNVTTGEDFQLRLFEQVIDAKIINNTFWPNSPPGSNQGVVLDGPTGTVLANNVMRYFTWYNGATLAYEDHNIIGQYICASSPCNRAQSALGGHDILLGQGGQPPTAAFAAANFYNPTADSIAPPNPNNSDIIPTGFKAHWNPNDQWDMHLKSGSMAINNGDATQAPATDADGNPRLNPTSIGAYEYGASPTSNTDTTPPTTPTGLGPSTAPANVKTATTIGLLWNPSTDSGGSGLAGYRLYRDGNLIATVTDTGYTDYYLSPNTTYTYKVAAYDQAGNVSADSGNITVTTEAIIGDLDGDIHVTGHDLSILLSHYNTHYVRGEFDGYSLVEGHDLSMLLSNYGK